MNGLLYVVGGDDGSCNLASVEYYNPVTDKWTLLPTNMSTGRDVVRCSTPTHTPTLGPGMGWGGGAGGVPQVSLLNLGPSASSRDGRGSSHVTTPFMLCPQQIPEHTLISVKLKVASELFLTTAFQGIPSN